MNSTLTDTSVLSGEPKESPSEDTLTIGGVIFLLVCVFLYLAAYLPLFYWIQHLIFYRKTMFLFASQRYTLGALITFLVLQVPMGGYVLFELLRFRRPQMHVSLWIALAVFNVPAFFLLPAYRAVDAAGVHRGAFYGVSTTTPWNEIQHVSITLTGIKNYVTLQYVFQTKADPTHPIYVTVPVSNRGALGGEHINAVVKAHHIQEQVPKVSPVFLNRKLLYTDLLEWDIFIEETFVGDGASKSH